MSHTPESDPAFVKMMIWRVSAFCGLITFSVAAQQPPVTENSPPANASKEAFESVMKKESAEKEDVLKGSRDLLSERYFMEDRPSEVMMSAERKAVQRGVRVRLAEGLSWEKLAESTPKEIRDENLFPMGFRPLPHPKHPVGGQVFPAEQIKAIQDSERRSLDRFDVAFDLPPHLTPEFPPPMFLSNRPDLGDVTQGQVLTIKNYYDLLHDKLTPVQLDGMRQLLTPFPQQQFNQTHDRKSVEPELGVACLDCHTNGHTNAAFHLNPDTRPQAARFRLDSVSLRGMFNQQIHGSKRSLRSIEDFSEFEQRTAYFDGDQAMASLKGVNEPDRATQVSLMAQMQNMINFPPAPKLDVFGRLRPELATDQELAGEKLFFGKARCSECHPAPFYLDDKMHDLKLERFYKSETIRDQLNLPDGPIKTFTLRGIKDSPPYHHDGRLLTLDDTVEFFNLVLELKLNADEKSALLSFLYCL